MREAPLVSIIIPTYNDRSAVTEAVDCSLNQTYVNREVIVVDDGSTDGTDRLLREEYKDRIIFVRQANKGPGAARNTGVRRASGKYLQFLDADDLLDPEKIEIQVRLLEGISGRALSYCDYALFQAAETIAKPRRVSPLLEHGKPFDDIMLKWETELEHPRALLPVGCGFFQGMRHSFR